MRLVKLVCSMVFASMANADLTLESVDREILKTGLHRTMRTNVTYTTTLAQDLKYCSYVFRENITADMYVYYEEVTRDMPGFENWPHHLPMNIEEPAQISKAQDFVWRLPLKARQPNSFIKNWTSSAPGYEDLP